MINATNEAAPQQQAAPAPTAEYTQDKTVLELPAPAAKPADVSNGATLPLTKAMLSDKLISDRGDLVDVADGSSQVYRDRYAEVMRDFHAGQLRSHGNCVVKDVSEAKAMAADQAHKMDASSDEKAPSQRVDAVGGA